MFALNIIFKLQYMHKVILNNYLQEKKLMKTHEDHIDND
jgi:hypothetical protein